MGSERQAANKKKFELKTYKSFEEKNESNAKARANLSPEQHLINVTQMIKKVYAMN